MNKKDVLHEVELLELVLNNINGYKSQEFKHKTLERLRKVKKYISDQYQSNQSYYSHKRFF